MSNIITEIMLNELGCNFRKWRMTEQEQNYIWYYNKKYNLTVTMSELSTGSSVYRLRGGDLNHTGTRYFTCYSENSMYKFIIDKIKKRGINKTK